VRIKDLMHTKVSAGNGCQLDFILEMTAVNILEKVMKRWALLVVAMYFLTLIVISAPVLIAAFGMDGLEVIGEQPLTVAIFSVSFAGVMALLQAALLVVPVRIDGQRPVSKRWVFWPLLAAATATLLLVLGTFASVYETIGHTQGQCADWFTCAAIVIAAFWVIWAFFFGFYAGVADPRTMMSRLAKMLIAGSILELLVAIPAHILARMRNYCCAGWGTFVGLAFGIAVALMAFGPAVFVLIAKRRASLQPKQMLQNASPPKNNVV
jgi:hypothetical protein